MEKRDFKTTKKRKDFWEKYKDISFESCFGESNYDESIQDRLNSKKKDLVIEKKGEDGKYESLGNNDRRVQLKSEEPIFKPN